MHNNPSSTLPPKPKSLKSKISRKTRRRRHNHKPNTLLTQQFSHNMNPKGFNLWRKTYENIMSWQSEHQVNYWRNQAENFRNINKELWTKLQKYENTESELIDKDDKIPKYETSSSEEDYDDKDKDINNKSEIDEEYLKFLEITHKHQNDRNLLGDETEDKIAEE